MEILHNIAVIKFNMDSWLIYLLSGLILLLIVISIILFHIRNARNLIRVEWKKLWLLLYRRHNLLPNFLETFKHFFPAEKKIFQEIIGLKNQAAFLNEPGSEKMHAELNLSLKLAEIIEKCRSSQAILVDTNFLELRQELKENAHKIDGELVAYNNKIRQFNLFLEKAHIKPLVIIFRVKKEAIFEFEAGF